MSTLKEKALQMKQDFDAVHEAGKQSVIANSKYTPKTATGKVISLTDVSEVYHKVKVYGDGQEVEVYGKNLCDYTKAFARDASSSLVIDETTNSIIYNGNYYFKIPMKLPSGQPVTVSGEGVAYFLFEYEDGSLGDNKQVLTKIPEKTTRNIYLYKNNPTVSEVGYVFRNIQVELGSNATLYEPHKGQTIIATPNGTEIDSMCPNMTFIANEEIKVDYYSSFGMAEKELAMWNSFTNHGKRETYTDAFDYTDYSGYTIPSGLCRPKAAIGRMFYAYQGAELPRGIDCSGFNVDTTVASYHCQNIFAYATNLKYVYDMGIPASKYYTGAYRSCNALEVIEIIRAREESAFDSNCFNGCSKLTHVIFSGVIASDINLQWSPLLDDESLVSISVALCDLVFSGFGDGWGSRTLTLSAESIARLKELPYPPDDLNPEGAPYAEDGASCYTVIVSRKGWNIA